jgi:hypothetical protein
MMCWDLHPLPPPQYIIKARCLSTHVTFVPFSTYKSGTRHTPQTLLLYPNSVTFIYEQEWRPVWAAEHTYIHRHAGRATCSLKRPWWRGFLKPGPCMMKQMWGGGARRWRRSVGIPELPHLWTTKCQKVPDTGCPVIWCINGQPLLSNGTTCDVTSCSLVMVYERLGGSSGSKTEKHVRQPERRVLLIAQPWRWTQYVPLKRR